MATGVLTSAQIYPTSSGINAGVYDSRAAQWSYPVAGILRPATIAGPLSFIVPAIPSYAMTGKLATGFYDDFYNRIHVSPVALALGALASNLSRTVQVWNAHVSVSETLNTISASGDPGISITGPATPTTYAPNQAINYSVTILTDGPPVINASYLFTFADGETVLLPITGVRLAAWSVIPNWDGPVLEGLAWQTDILRAWSGKEMRRATRIAPRRTFRFDALAQQVERRILETALFAWSAQTWALPIWPDGQLLGAGVAAGATSIPCTTANIDFAAGGLAILIADAETFEMVQVQSISPTGLTLSAPTQNMWGTNARLYPVRQAKLLQYPAVTRENGVIASISPTFTITEPCDWPAASGLPTYRGLPVLEDSPDDATGQESGFSRQAAIIDNTTGAIEIDDQAQLGFPHYQHSWFLQGTAARAAFRSLLYSLKGRQGELWVPTYHLDLTLLQDITAGATTILTENIGYSTYAAGAQNRQDIRIELLSGTVYYRRITGGIALSSTQESLSIDSSIGVVIPAANVRRISFMALCRLSSDLTEIVHETAATAAAGLATAVTPFTAVNHAV
ncbi:MAG: hypothetical protein JSR67_03635 [Proteobacteria bacterium]|nr:hypothetical protein [Pseudomonadota bacterium]